MIVVVDYGLGNLGSIRNMLNKIGIDHLVSDSADKIARATALVLPGVGAFDQGMRNLNDYGLITPLSHKVLDQRTPVLGICLGMQLFTDASEEGALPGLGWIHGRAIKFDSNVAGVPLKVPHMGWCDVRFAPGSSLALGFQQDARFYFVHSYHVVCENAADVAGSADYGRTFTAAVQHENIWGVQFHPEKSHRYGMQLLRNFCVHVR